MNTNNAATPAADALPPGVTEAGQPAPAADAPPATMDAGNVVPSAKKKWNWLEIGAGIALLTLTTFAIYYYRQSLIAQNSDSVEKDRKIKALQTDMGKIKAMVAPAA